jgi:hypothetical protein
MTRKYLGLIAAALAVLTGLAYGGAARAADESAKDFCSAPEYRQFNFWLGDWDAYDVGGSTTPSAHVKIDRALKGCALREQYEGADGYRGESLSMYDRSRKVWQQSWFTNHGYMLTIEGTFHDGEMELTGSDFAPDGRERRVRGIWKAEDGGVRETAYRSTDGGKTWTLWLDLQFKLRK